MEEEVRESSEETQEEVTPTEVVETSTDEEVEETKDFQIRSWKEVKNQNNKKIFLKV